MHKKYLEELTQGNKELKQELLKLFFDGMGKNLPLLHDLSSSVEEDKRWKEIIHEVKGSSLSLGFANLTEKCRQAEQIPAASVDEKKAILQGMEQDIASLAQDFSDLLG